jgi:hypothetical protein
MRVINVCGFNLSGCSAAFDFFYDYETTGSVNREFHESGFLKCKYTFGGAIQSVLLGLEFRPKKESLLASLQGGVPTDYIGDADSLAVHNHLVSRRSMAAQYGDEYKIFTEDALRDIPDNIAELPKNVALLIYEQAAINWLTSLIEHVPADNFHLNYKDDNSIMLFKNDPPGKFPYIASLIPNGVSFSVLRNPVDACFDYNRFYHFGHSQQTVINYCKIFGSWARTVKNQLKIDANRVIGKYYVVRFEDLINEVSVRQRMLAIVGLDKTKKMFQNFQPQESAKNIGIGQEMPKHLINLTKQMCMGEYNSLIDILRLHNLLIE